MEANCAVSARTDTEVLPAASFPLSITPVSLSMTSLQRAGPHDNTQSHMGSSNKSSHSRHPSANFVAPPPPPPLPIPQSSPETLSQKKDSNGDTRSISAISSSNTSGSMLLGGDATCRTLGMPLVAKPPKPATQCAQTGHFPSSSTSVGDQFSLSNLHLNSRELSSHTPDAPLRSNPTQIRHSPYISQFQSHRYAPHSIVHSLVSASVPSTFVYHQGVPQSTLLASPPPLRGLTYSHSQHHSSHKTYPPSHMIPQGVASNFQAITPNFHTSQRLNPTAMPVSPRRSTTPPPPPRPPKPPELEYHPNGQSALTGAKQSAEHDAVSAMPNNMPMERQAPAELSVRAGDIGEISSAIPHGPARTEISLVDATKSPNLGLKAVHSSISSQSPNLQSPSSPSLVPAPFPHEMLPRSAEHRRDVTLTDNYLAPSPATGNGEQNRFQSNRPLHERTQIDEVDDVNSDSGMTMDAYDATAYDFPRMVNQDMINAAERQLQNPPTQGTSPTDSQTQRPATMDSGNYYARGIDDPSQSGIAGSEADSPPPYEQVSAMEMAGSTRESNTEVLREAAATLSTTNENGFHFSSITRLSSPSPPPVFRNHSISLHEPITTATVVPHAPSGIVTTQTILSPLEASSVRLSPTDGGGSLSPSGSSQAGPLNTRDHWVAPVLSDEPGPAIITSPPTPSPSHSPTNHTLSPAFSGPSRPSRRFTVSSTDSPRSVTSSSDSDDPFQDPPTFQQDSSPFAPTKVDMFHPTHVGAAESYFVSNHTMIAPFNNGETAAPGNWAHDSAISAAWPATGAPSTPYSEAGSNEVHRSRANTAKSFPRSPVEGLLTNSFVSHSPTSTQPESSTDTPGAKDAKRWSNRISRPSSSSRMSMFFRSSSTTNAQGNTPDGLSPSRSTFGRKSGIDLLGDSTISDERESYMNEGLQQESSLDPGSHDQQTAPGPSLQLSPLDVWNGIEFGFRSPNWQSPPRVGSDQRLRWHDNITLYPTGSDPFFIRAPSWRLLLRFLASQSTTRIEPSVEALATSRNPTLDLRLVMQFVRTPYAPKGSSRDVCLYFMLHTEMPAAHTKSGRSIPTAERLATEHWDTSVLPYSFVCGDSSLLRKQRTNTGETCTSKHTGCKCTPIDLQDPDGANSMFVTLPPPFIRLPVNLSAVAMYLHESFVLSRRHGKGKGIQEGPIRADSDRSSKMRKIHHGENSGERIDLGPHDSKLTSGNANVPGSPGSLQISGDRPDLSPRSIAPSQVPGIKRLAKAIKTFYPDEYALGSSRSNAGAHAGVQDDRLPKEKRMNVANTNKHGGANKGGLLGTLSRIKGKSSVAKHAVAELGAAASLGSHTRRDTNEERYELVTPWTMRND